MSQYLYGRHALSIALALLGLVVMVGGGWLSRSRPASDVAPDAVGAPRVSAQPDMLTEPGSPPALPSSLYGYVEGAQVGNIVAAAVGGVVVAEAPVITSEGRPFYALNVPADDPATPAVEGGSPGAAVELRLDDRPAGTAAWEPGGNLALDLPAPAVP